MDYLIWLAAATPVLVLLFLMVQCGWGGDEASSVGLISAIIIAGMVFGAKLDMIALAVAKGMWTALSIVMVIIPALAIYEVSCESGAFAVFRAGMQRYIGDPVVQILAIGWIFVGFLQGITGFGVPVAVGAPLLIGLGVKPFTAVQITLLGQAWGNTFGTLAIAWDGLIGQVDLSDPIIYKQTILWATAMLGVLNFLAGLAIAFLAGGYQGLKKNLPLIVLLGVLQGVGQMWLALLNTALSNFLMTTLSLVFIFCWARFTGNRGSIPAEPSHSMTLLQAIFPYFVLTVTAVVVLLSGSIKGVLGKFAFGFPFAAKISDLGYATKEYVLFAPIAPLIHSGAFLAVAVVAGFGYYKSRKLIGQGGLGRITANTWKKSVPSAIAVTALIAMSKVMDETGQVYVLARGAADITGGFFPLLSPYVGLLGSFMTSSNLSSNILFGGFQETVASILNADKAPILAAQTAGAAVGSIIAPSKVLLGTTTAGIMGQEGQVIKKFLVGALLLCGIFGIAVMAAQMRWG